MYFPEAGTHAHIRRMRAAHTRTHARTFVYDECVRACVRVCAHVHACLVSDCHNRRTCTPVKTNSINNTCYKISNSAATYLNSHRMHQKECFIANSYPAVPRKIYTNTTRQYSMQCASTACMVVKCIQCWNIKKNYVIYLIYVSK